MNKANTWMTIIAILVLVGVGIYLIKENKEPEETTYVEVIDGEEVVLNYPLTESFSNAASNKKDDNKIGAATTSSSPSVFSHVVETMARPFTLAFYYLSNINKEGPEGCNTDEEVTYPDEYDFELTDTIVYNDSAYLFVDAEESPENICSHIMEFNSFTSNFLKAVKVIVN